MDPDPGKPDNRDRYGWLAVGVFAVALVLRLLAARGDLWLDEVWSLWQVRGLQSPLGVFTQLRYDNNHHLNSLVVWAIGPDAAPIWHRLPAVLAGSAAAAAAMLFIGGPSRTRLVIAGVVMTGSYLLVHYASEARGYAYLQLFTVLAVVFADRLTKEWRWRDAALVAGCSALGLCSHLTFGYCFAGAAGLTLVRLVRSREGLGTRVAKAAVALGVPALLFGGLYVVSLRGMVVGGGGESTVAETLLSALSLAAGGPATGPWQAVWAVGLVLLVATGLWRIAKQDTAWLAFFGALIAAPLVVLAIQPTDLLYPRYFLVWVPLLLWPVCSAIEWLWQRRGGWALAGASLAVLFLAGNAAHLADLYRWGRGDYSGALALIRDRSTDPVTTIGSDHDFRNRLMIAHVASRNPPSRPERYCPRDEWPDEGVEWLLVHDQSPANAPHDELSIGSRWDYRLVRQFPAARLSGWRWSVYRRVGGAEQPLAGR